MKKAKNLILYIGIIALVVIAKIAAYKLSGFWIGMNIVSVFVVTAIVPHCRQHENMWLLIFTTIASIPINVLVTKEFYFAFDSGVPIIGTICSVIQVYLILWTIEQLVIGLVGRFIWRKQKNISLEDF